MFICAIIINMKKWLFKVNAGSIALILLGTLINIVGGLMASRLNLPWWLDSIGTFISAVTLGPVAGAISGALMNVIMELFSPGMLPFAIVSICGGLAVGVFFPRDRKIDSFSVIATALFAGFVMSVVCTPLNMYFNDGYTGNVWGDALVDMLAENVNFAAFRCLAGCLLVNMPDKAICILVTMLILWCARKVKDKKQIVTPILLLSLVFGAMMPLRTVAAGGIRADHSAVVYGVDDGLTSAEINTIAQTADGYIWAGAYSGLYRYDGRSFSQIQPDKRISNVIYLFEDHSGRLWIGTNDSGVACYDTDTAQVDFYTVKEGLAADSIRSICEDDEGGIYVSTTKELCRIYNGQIQVFTDETELRCIYSLKNMGNGCIAGVTKNGLVFVMKEGKVVCTEKSGDDSYSYTAIAATPEGDVLAGTSADILYRYEISTEGMLKEKGSFSVEGLSYVNHIAWSDQVQGYLVAATRGLFLIGWADNIENLSMEGFDAAVSDAITDAQGNLWFASSQQGILKLSPSSFTDPAVAGGIQLSAANSLLAEQGSLLIGTDTGLHIIDIKSGKEINNALTERLEGIRIRHLFRDSNRVLWLSTYAQEGLMRADTQGNIISVSEQENGLIGSRYRFCLELTDGTILAASTDGIDLLKDGRPVGSIGAEQGMEVPQVLSAVECEDGSILAGTDGGGVYRIRNGAVVGHIGSDEGLLSQVVMRIVPCRGGYIYVTSNGLYYGMADDPVRHLENFPYNNVYDVYITEDDVAWVSSSAGIFVVNLSDLLGEADYQYVLLNRSRGFDASLTANAHSAVDGDILYLCCADGVRSVNTKSYNSLNEDYDIRLSAVKEGEQTVSIEDGVYRIPSGKGRIQIQPAVLNYAMSDPLLSIELEGVDTRPLLFHQSELPDLYYNNLPHGDYSLSIKVLDDLSGAVKKEKIFYLHKDAELYEMGYYKLYLVLVGTMLVAFLAWTIAKMGNMAVINRQYDQIREAKEEAEYANKAKSRFLANMSHEIRTPINAVLGMDEMILRESNEKEIREYAADIYSAGNTLLALINDILDSSKIESGKMELVLVEYELKELIRNLVNMIKRRAQEKDLVLNTEVDENLPSVLYGDDVRIRQVVTNILTNAVKYTHEGSVTLRISGVSENDRLTLRIEVEDTGIGIKEEDIPKLFEAYQRIEEGRNRNIEGTGLGMSITVQLLKMMGSELKVESTYGKGSRFWFELEQKIIERKPMGNIERGAADDESRFRGSFTAPDAKVLVVDDNALNLRVFRSLIKHTGMQISEASSGAESLKLAEEKHYDLVFLDHMMPDMDGIETLHHMRKIEGYDKVPIYMLSANALSGVKEQYLEEGFDGYLAKPIVSEKLEQAIRENLPEQMIKPYTGTADVSPAVNEETETEDDNDHEYPLIDGLDWDYAKIHLPDHELLMDTIRNFYNSIDASADKLCSLKGDPDAYRIKVHSMKSSAAIIGIVPLAGMARILEKAAADGDDAVIEKIHDIFIGQWRSYKDKLRELVYEEDEEKPAGDNALLLTHIERMDTAIDEYDVNEAEDIFEKIDEYSYEPAVQELLEKLRSAIEQYDMDMAKEIAAQIKEIL